MGWGPKNARRKTATKKRSKKASILTKSVVAVDPQMQRRWDSTKTVRANYVDMGLLANPNTEQAAASNPIALVVPEVDTERETYLTLAEIVNVREMVQKHGADYLGMWRDIKLNRYQHTKRKLKKMCEIYLLKYADRDPLFTGAKK